MYANQVFFIIDSSILCQKIIAKLTNKLKVDKVTGVIFQLTKKFLKKVLGIVLF